MPNANEPRDEAGISRRDFVRGVGSVALGASALQAVGSGRLLADDAPRGPSPSAPAETAVARFYRTLSPEQKNLICFPVHHPKRRMVNNNWKIVEPTIGDLKTEQKELCREIFKNLCSDEGYERFQRQMKDDYGGFEAYHVAVFGEPGSDKPFEWVLSGRHDTLRADGNSVEGAAFDGPIFYGHAADGHFNQDSKHTNNVWWYQGERADAIFRTFDEKQRGRALISRGKDEADGSLSIILKREALEPKGIDVADLDGSQKEMVRQLFQDMTMPFRKFEADEVRERLTAEGDVDKLRLTYYKDGEVGSDGVWDVWKLEGPAFSWYYHGTPHVHVWLNVARKAAAYEPPMG